ncbi:MAG: hypothetical protein U9R41_07950 [Candidatus Marinimicrobia bacterium]|nr:hypothetical protein [Candidatus Neomarinimicrobiota bacterium]
MSFGSIFGAWVNVFLMLAILSYLYKDNPFYKIAEHIYIGVSAAYWGTIAFWNQVWPNLFGRLWPQVDNTATLSGFNKFWYKIYNGLHWFSHNIFPENGIPGDQSQNLWYIIAFFLGLFMLARLIPSINWLGRWSLAYVVGMAAGLRIYGFMSSNVIAQIHGSILPLWGSGVGIGDAINNLVLIVGTVSGLFYFFFSVEHKGIFGKISRVGIYFLMISFGASFGFAVMGRISLLIGRFNRLIEYSSKQYGYATIILLVVMVATLLILNLKKTEEVTE